MGNKSTPIFKLGLAGIAISIVIMQCTGFIIQGFKSDINKKIALFNGYGQVESAISNKPYLQNAENTTLDLQKIGAKCNPFLTASITLQTKQGINSVILSGYQSLPKKWNCSDSDAVYLSQTLFNKLALDDDSTASGIIATGQDDYTVRKLKFIPVFESNLEDIDQKTAYMHLPALQNIAQLGGEFRYYFKGDTLVGAAINTTEIKINGSVFDAKKIEILITAWPVKVEITDNNDFNKYYTISSNTAGNLNNHEQYITAIRIENALSKQRIKSALPYNLLFVSSPELYPQLYNWLNLLYTNVAVIIALVLGIALINNCSVLLVLIIEKTQLIAILKALGAEEKSIKKVFTYTGFKLNLKALIIGNTIALGLAFSQWQWHWLTLNPKDYFVAEVPFAFDISFFVLINLAALILPIMVSYLPLKILKKMNAAALLRLN